jgi:hypothetical protein
MLPASMGEAAIFWTSDSNGSMGWQTHMDSSRVFFLQERSRLDRLAVRCVANPPDTVPVSLPNPGFETGTTEGWSLEGWDSTAMAVFQAVRDTAGEGSWIGSIDADAAAEWSVRLRLPSFDVVAGAAYRVRFWLDGAGPIPARVIDPLNPDTPLWSGEFWPTAAAHEMDVAFSSGALSGFGSLVVELDMGRTTGIKRIDDLRIESVR